MSGTEGVAAFCTECGKALRPDAKFCASCGHAVEEGSPALLEASTAPRPPAAHGGSTAPAAASAGPAATAAKAKPNRPRWRKKRYWIPAALVVLIAIIGGTSSNKKNNNGSDTPQTTVASADVATSKPAVPKSVTSARSYASRHAHEINTVHVMVQSVQIAVALAQKSPTQDSLNQLAQIAQQAHDSIDGVRQDFADTSDSGSLGNAELEVFTAANDLKNSMGALVAYTGDPNAATLAHFTSQYGPAIAEWNDGIRVIWRAAHRKKPPLL
jgi:rRNA maturation endonuclease Nob1